MLLMIDNYDSFTYSVVQYFRELGAEVEIIRNNECGIGDVVAMAPERIVISPGPCSPDEAGISVGVIRQFAGVVPILGVCLGHQCIGRAFGGRIVRAKRVMHGKTSTIHHSGRGIYSGVSKSFVATRYHSLVVDGDDLPKELEVSAWTQAKDGSIGEIMGGAS